MSKPLYISIILILLPGRRIFVPDNSWCSWEESCRWWSPCRRPPPWQSSHGGPPSSSPTPSVFPWWRPPPRSVRPRPFPFSSSYWKSKSDFLFLLWNCFWGNLFLYFDTSIIEVLDERIFHFSDSDNNFFVKIQIVWSPNFLLQKAQT